MSQSDTWHDDVPISIRRLTLVGLGIMLFGLGGFGFWAGTAPLAAAIISSGSFVATGQNQIVQHFEGGVIKTILVREGDHVDEGQVMLVLDETAAEASRQELYLRSIRLRAVQARLLAVAAGQEELIFPVDLTELAARETIHAILEAQYPAFRANRANLANDIAQVERNMDALEARRQGYEEQKRSYLQIVENFKEDLRSKGEMLDRGLITRASITSLQRAAMDAEGQLARVDAEIKEIDHTREKSEAQIRATRDKYLEASLAELQTVEAELETVRETIRKAEKILERTEIRAPASGTVVRLLYHTPGGVIEPGSAIAELLPSNVDLIVECLVQRSDIDVLKPGQTASVKLVGLNQRTTPILIGRVDYISADAISQSAATSVREVYLVRVSLDAAEIGRLHHVTLKSGMPVQIMIQTEERTFAEYILKPVMDSMSRAFREQ